MNAAKLADTRFVGRWCRFRRFAPVLAGVVALVAGPVVGCAEPPGPKSAASSWAADAKTEALLLFARTSALRSSVKVGDFNRVREILDAHPEWVQSPDLEGKSLLHVAAFQGHAEMGKLLLARGAAVNALDNTGHTPLHDAALENKPELVPLLLSHGADFAATCARGLTPLEEACGKKALKVANLMLEAGANPNRRQPHGGTCLHLAAGKGDVEMGRLLLARGANVNPTNIHGHTPLHRAAAEGHRQFVDWLLQEGADAGVRDAEYRLALEIADENRHPEVARALRLHLASATRPPDTRRRILVAFFSNDTRDPAAAHWAFSLQSAVASRLEKVQRACVLSDSTLLAALRLVGLKPGNNLTVAKARELGEVTEAQRVVWASYRSTGPKWRAEGRVLNVASGKVTRTAMITGRDFCELRTALALALLKPLQLTATTEEKKQIAGKQAMPAEIISPFSQLRAAGFTREPLPDIERRLRTFLEAQPTNIFLSVALAEALSTQGKLEESEHILRDVVNQDRTNWVACRCLAEVLLKGKKPDEPERLLRNWVACEPEDVDAHWELGRTLWMLGQLGPAEKELLAALRLAPDEVDVLVSIGKLYEAQNKTESALHYWDEAIRLAPLAAGIHALLGAAYAQVGDRNLARDELERAARLDPDSLEAEMHAASAYRTLGDFPKALAAYEHWVDVAETAGIDPDSVEEIRQIATELRQRLQSTPVKASPPRNRTADELEAELCQRLTAQELKLVVNPIATTPAMRDWALELTRHADTDEQRGRAIYEALADRIQQPGEHNARTAQEIFAAWGDPKAFFVCNEFAKLFVALAREVGLRAFYVHLERDYRDEVVYHDCAIVFLPDKALLVDPAYKWFGVPHRQFTVLDDLQTFAHHLSQPSKSAEDLKRHRIGVKLHPDSAWARVSLATALVQAGRRAQAEEELAEAARLEPGRWDLHVCAANIAADRGDLLQAEAELRTSIEMNPKCGSAHGALGRLLNAQGKRKEAAAEFRLALDCALTPELQRLVRRELVLINEEDIRRK